MQNHLLRASMLALTAFWAGFSAHAEVPQQGLWVGEVILGRVNETVVGINAQNQTVAPNPTNTTPVQSPAHLRIILHVDDQGQTRLLKNVAIVDKSTNGTPDLVLLTDESLYANYTGPARRISAVAFDFGDGNANDLLTTIAIKAADAAAASSNATNAANAIAQKANLEANYQAFVSGVALRNAALNCAGSAAIGAIQTRNSAGTAAQIGTAATNAAAGNALIVTNRAYALTLQNSALFTDTRYVAAVDAIIGAAASAAATAANSNFVSTAVGSAATNAALLAITNAISAPAVVSAGYLTFIGTSTFQSAANLAAAAATTAAKQAIAANSLPALVQNKAQAAALKALTDAGIFTVAEKVVNRELPMTGSLEAGGTLTGTIFLGASHPTNPFMHRRHVDHRAGFDITRSLRIQFDAANGTNAVSVANFGVDRIFGSYREEIGGLHKPLGPNQNIGLITEGSISLSRISSVGVLNQ